MPDLPDIVNQLSERILRLERLIKAHKLHTCYGCKHLREERSGRNILYVCERKPEIVLADELADPEPVDNCYEPKFA